MEIQLAQEDNLIEILYLIENTKLDLQRNNLYHWNDNYTGRDIIRKDILEKKTYYLKVNKVIVGTVTVYDGNDPLYKEAEYIKNNYLLIRRLAVFHSFQKKGVAGALFNYIVLLAKEKGLNSIITEAYHKNERYVNFLQKKGFTSIGEVKFPAQDIVFNCYEYKV